MAIKSKIIGAVTKSGRKKSTIRTFTRKVFAGKKKTSGKKRGRPRKTGAGGFASDKQRRFFFAVILPKLKATRKAIGKGLNTVIVRPVRAAKKAVGEFIDVTVRQPIRARRLIKQNRLNELDTRITDLESQLTQTSLKGKARKTVTGLINDAKQERSDLLAAKRRFDKAKRRATGAVIGVVTGKAATRVILTGAGATAVSGSFREGQKSIKEQIKRETGLRIKRELTSQLRQSEQNRRGLGGTPFRDLTSKQRRDVNRSVRRQITQLDFQVDIFKSKKRREELSLQLQSSQLRQRRRMARLRRKGERDQRRRERERDAQLSKQFARTNI